MKVHRPLEPGRFDHWYARAKHARQHDEPVYVTVVEWDELEASMPPPEPEAPYWTKVGEPPPVRAEGATLLGHPLEVDDEKALDQAARAESSPATRPFEWEGEGDVAPYR